MKTFFLTLLLLLILPSVSFALCLYAPDFDNTSLDSFYTSLQSHFPFSIFSFVLNTFTDLDTITPVSPSGWSFTVFTITFTPFAIFSSGIFDTLMSALRWFVVAIFLFSVFRFTIDQIL